jgi:hypothetical protein
MLLDVLEATEKEIACLRAQGPRSRELHLADQTTAAMAGAMQSERLARVAPRVWLDYVVKTAATPSLSTETVLRVRAAFLMAMMMHGGVLLPFVTFGALNDALLLRPVATQFTAMRCGLPRIRYYISYECFRRIPPESIDDDLMLRKYLLEWVSDGPLDRIVLLLRDIIYPRISLFCGGWQGQPEEAFTDYDWVHLSNMTVEDALSQGSSTSCRWYGAELDAEVQRILCEFAAPDAEWMTKLVQMNDTYYDVWEELNGLRVVESTPVVSAAAAAESSVLISRGVGL